eukprot:TRINITY_DN14506_c0_g1_i1.p1 TRINITY_DN14506_c0_g1~~TRINITY_DN14506_c0_g1_i1.p1  ORF type:complete len:488 (+),score=113.28 TRINITY_DN14506_c0_g1_i1:208-1464(+)
MGVDSGLPDFRGSTGLFKDRKLALTYEEMSNDKWFFEDPAFAWGINYTQLAMYRKTKPHSGFDALLKWMEDLSKPFYVFTSNIDSQFQKAGFPDDRVVTCHGELHWLQCVNYKCKGGGRNPRPEAVWSAECIPDGLDEHIDPATLKFKDVSLLEAKHFRCPHCGELARPNVWFCTDRNHVGWKAEYDKREAYNKWLSKDIYENGKRLVVVECGGGMAIPTVRCEGEDAVENAGEGSMLIRLNPSDCKVPNDRAVGLPFGAAEGLKRLGEAMQRLKKGDSAGQKRSSGQQPGLGIASAAAKAKATTKAAGAPPRSQSPLRAASGAVPKSASPAAGEPSSSKPGRSASRTSLASAGAAALRPSRPSSAAGASVASAPRNVGGEAAAQPQQDLLAVLAEFNLSGQPQKLREELRARLQAPK